ncbi:type III polyketide synthase [Microbacterium sp. RD1]|uniref:type III polyketide synthase n=1 Tax=Microbacterium sp. RD1 TaxID=3457313 RepID=UPI003FA55345
MTASILGLGTAVPPTRLTQPDVRDFLAAQPGLDRRARRLLQAAFDAAAIDTRHTVLAELGPTGGGLHVRDGEQLLSPSTRERNDEFVRAAPALFAAAARDALAAARVDAHEVTHVVTVSCTGLIAPGPDFRLVRDLGLSSTVERDHLGFVGCAAAVPALRQAARIVASDPGAVVLVAAAELCSLHIRGSADPEQIVAASVFGDGAAAAVVSGDPARGGDRRLELTGFATRLSDEGAADMTWKVGDDGFEMRLTAEVPRIVGREVRAVVDDVFGGPDDLDAWAVHPGGRSILDRVQAGLGLADDALTASREVLRRYGNMSSATLLFILRDILADPARPDGQRLGALAFGPGLTLEAARMVLRDRTADAAALVSDDRRPALVQR